MRNDRSKYSVFEGIPRMSSKFFNYKKHSILWTEIASVHPTLPPPDSVTQPYNFMYKWVEVVTKQGVKIIVDESQYGEPTVTVRADWHEALREEHVQ